MRQMMRRWHQIPQVRNPFSAVTENRNLMPLAVPLRNQQTQPRKQLRIPVQQLQLPPFRNWRQVVGPESVRVARRGLMRLLPAAPLDIVGCLGERRHHIPLPVHPGCAPGVAEMQVRQHHPVHIPRPHPQGLQAPHQPAGHQPVHLLVLDIILGPNPGIHQDILAAAPQQQAIQPHRNPVLAVRADPVLPDHLGNPAENRPPIYLEHAVRDNRRAGS